MGIDGRQTLHIRGPLAMIDEIEASGGVIDGNEEIMLIADRFFGKNAMIHRSARSIVFNYEFRNEPINQYLEALLKRFPKCWMKNEYHTEDGNCGMWIGRFIGNEVKIQVLNWTELTIEEELMEEDFSQFYYT